MERDEHRTADDQSTTFVTNNNEPGFKEWCDFGFDLRQDIPTMSSVAQSVMQNKGIKYNMCFVFIEPVGREMDSFFSQRQLWGI
jgi:hypothetical protein